MKLNFVLIVFFIPALAIAQSRYNLQDSIFLEDKYTIDQSKLEISEDLEKSLRKDIQVHIDNQSVYFEAKCYHLLGIIKYEHAVFDSSQFYLKRASELRHENGFLEAHATSQEELAKVLFRIGEDSLALQHLYIALAIKENTGKEAYLKSLYNTLGNAHYHLSNLDSALYYYTEARYLFENEKDTFGLAAVYNNLGNVLFEQDLNSEARLMYQTSRINYEKVGMPSEAAVPLYNIGSVFEWEENYDSAFVYYKKALVLVQKEGNMAYADAIYLELARTYAILGQADSSAAMFEKYIAFRDTVFEKSKRDAVLKYETEFQTQETEKKLLKSELTSKKRQQLNYMLLSIFGIATLIAFFLIRNYRQKKKLSELELDVKNKEIDNLLKVQEAKSYAALLEGQSAERVRIAQDLHDHLGATLSAVKIQFEAMDQQIEQLKGENKKQFAKMNEMINEAVKDVRRISHDLSSGKLAEQGLRGVLNDLAEIINTSGRLKVSFYMDEKIRNLPHKVEKELYAVIQEAMSNVLKHAQANHVDLQLNLQEDIVNVIIEDDGIGFAMDDAKDKGLGIQGMSNRLKKVNGEINFDSKIGRGTIIIINIPYDSNSVD